MAEHYTEELEIKKTWEDISPFDHHDEPYEYYIYNYQMTMEEGTSQRALATWPDYNGNQQYSVYYGLIPFIDNSAVKFKNVNNIISQNLYPTVPSNMFQSFVSPNLYKTLYIYEKPAYESWIPEDAGENPWNEYILPYVYNWTYKNQFSNLYQFGDLDVEGTSQFIANDPINGIVDVTMPIYIGTVCIGYPQTEYIIEYSLDGEHTYSQAIWDASNRFYNNYIRIIDLEIPIEGAYNPEEYNADYLIGGRDFTYRGFKLWAADGRGSEEDEYKTFIYEWKIVRSCWPYALYYVNKYGAIDSLLVDGKSLKTDNQNFSSYTKNAVPGTPEFGKTNYLNTITETWTLNTGPMTEDQASRMHHLLESNYVWVYNIEESTFTPVTITNKSCEYKTYHNQGKKFPTYTITVESAQQKYNR